jgi:RNA polymerase sigma-70 factor (ECF subfamily)
LESFGDTDGELLQRALHAPEGDLRFFELLVQRHQKKIVANCRYLTRDPGYAEDLAQEVFVKAYFGLRRFEGRSAFKTWLQRIKVNHCLNHLKKQEGKTFVDVEDSSLSGSRELAVQPTAEREAVAGGERERIGKILDSMADTLRIPLIMRDMDQLSYEEVAEALGLGLSAVKMRIKRAREQFQSRYLELTGQPL